MIIKIKYKKLKKFGEIVGALITLVGAYFAYKTYTFEEESHTNNIEDRKKIVIEAGSIVRNTTKLHSKYGFGFTLKLKEKASKLKDLNVSSDKGIETLVEIKESLKEQEAFFKRYDNNKFACQSSFEGHYAYLYPELKQKSILSNKKDLLEISEAQNALKASSKACETAKTLQSFTGFYQKNDKKVYFIPVLHSELNLETRKMTELLEKSGDKAFSRINSYRQKKGDEIFDSIKVDASSLNAAGCEIDEAIQSRNPFQFSPNMYGDIVCEINHSSSTKFVMWYFEI